MPYLTPDEMPTGFICRQLVIPDDLAIKAAINGALNDLCKPYNWEALEGAVDPETVAAAMNTMFRAYIASTDECP